MTPALPKEARPDAERAASWLESMSGANAGPSNGPMAFADPFSPRGSSEREARAVK
jgi:hypothetical protein